MQLSPIIAVHMTTALATLAIGPIGPIALWARKGAVQRPTLHRAFGYAWVTLTLATAVSAPFIRDYFLPNIAGYTLIHLFVPATFFSIFVAFWYLAKKNFKLHQRFMQGLYFGGCVGAGAFTLLPERYLGNLVWHQWLGVV